MKYRGLISPFISNWSQDKTRWHWPYKACRESVQSKQVEDISQIHQLMTNKMVRGCLKWLPLVPHVYHFMNPLTCGLCHLARLQPSPFISLQRRNLEILNAKELLPAPQSSTVQSLSLSLSLPLPILLALKTWRMTPASLLLWFNITADHYSRRVCTLVKGTLY